MAFAQLISASRQTGKREVQLEDLKKWTAAATSIQAHWRGHVQRKECNKLIQQYLHEPLPRAPVRLSNEEIMQRAHAAVTRRGLTLENCFRAVDSDADGKVTCEAFLEFLQLQKLDLLRSQLSRLVLILDEDCSGELEKKEFYETLAAYGVATEHHSQSNKTYQQEILIKFAQALDSRGITSDEVFRLCDYDESQAVSLAELRKFIEGAGFNFKDREIHALMTLLDADRSGFVTKDEFLKNLHKGEQGFKLEQVMAPTLSMKPPDSAGDEIRAIVKNMESKGTKVTEAFETMGIHSATVSISKLSRELTKWFGHVSRQDILKLLMQIDLDQNQMVDFAEFKAFLKKHSDPGKKSIKDTLALIARKTDRQTLSQLPSPLDVPQFSQLCQENFGIDQATSEALFHYLDLEGTGQVKVTDLEDVLKSYMEGEQSTLQPAAESKPVRPAPTVSPLVELKALLNEHSLSCINVFKFADYQNTGSLGLSALVNALRKLIPDIPEALLDRLNAEFLHQHLREFTLEQFAALFDERPPEVADHSLEISQLSASQIGGGSNAKPSAPPGSLQAALEKFPLKLEIAEVLIGYKLLPEHLYSLARLHTVMKTFEVSAEETGKLFTRLDGGKKGLVYGYMVYTELQAMLGQLPEFPVAYRCKDSEIAKELVSFIQSNINPQQPLYTQLPPLANRVQWPALFGSLSNVFLNKLQTMMPPKLYNFHIAALMQSYMSDLCICPLQLLSCSIFLLSPFASAGDLVVQSGRDLSKKVSAGEFLELTESLFGLKHYEARAVLKYLGINTEEEFTLYSFCTLCDRINSTFAEGRVARELPELPVADSSHPANLKEVFSSLSRSKLVKNLPVNETLDVAACSAMFEEELQLDQNAALTALKALSLHNILPRMYNLLFVLSTYSRPEESEDQESAQKIFKKIPESIRTQDFFQQFPAGRSAVALNIAKLVTRKLAGDLQIIEDWLKTTVNPQRKEAIFGYEFFTWVDVVREDIKTMPFKQTCQNKLDQAVFTKLSGILEAQQLGTADYIESKQSSIYEHLTDTEFRTLCSAELSSNEATTIFKAVATSGKISMMHFAGVLESYKLQHLSNGRLGQSPTAPPEHMAAPAAQPTQASPNKPAPKLEPALVPMVAKLKEYMGNSANKDIHSVFQGVAEEGSAQVNYGEFALAMQRLNRGFSKQQTQQLFKFASSGEYVDYPQFIAMLQSVTELPAVQPVPRESSHLKAIRAYQLDPSDYFIAPNEGYTTILNSETAALRRCLELLEEPGLFADPDFGPTQPNNGARCLYWKGKPPMSNFPDPQELVWRSPRSWLDSVCFFDENISSNDVIQGSLGDCWFIGALSVLATRDDKLCGSIHSLTDASLITHENAWGLSSGVYPPLFHSFAKRGLYVLRFFKDCAWRYVIVDELLPVYVPEDRPPQYVFGHCREAKELWVALIEKAYAKLHGCYESLNGGLIDDGLVDLTGHVAEKIKVKAKLGSDPTKTRQLADELWARLRTLRRDRSLMGCSIDAEGVESDVVVDGEVTGLLARHAYGIVDVLEVRNSAAPKGRHRLMRVRNPWGDREWCGKWSDKDPKLQENLPAVRREIDHLGEDEKFDPEDSSDGNFLMNFKDWRSLFDNFFACVDFPDEWWGVRFRSEWTPSNSGGVPTSSSPEHAKRWAQNPQFIVELQQRTELFATLMQMDGRHRPGSAFPFVESINGACFAVMRLSAQESRCTQLDMNKSVALSVVKTHREVHERMNLEPGKYAIVPSTMQPGKTGVFWLSLYFSVAKHLVKVYSAEDSRIEPTLIAEEEELKPGEITNETVTRYKEIVQGLSHV